MAVRGFLLLVLLALIPRPSIALERVARPLQDFERERGDQWSRSCSSTVSYFNYCNGWIWEWSGFGPEERVGVHYQVIHLCGDNPAVWDTYLYVAAAPPAGYGYTGTLSIHGVDPNSCPWAFPSETRTFLPSTGWNSMYWAGPASIPFFVVWTNGPAAGSPIAWGTDHPAAGPTGPPACGNCYPAGRMTHSYLLGTAASPNCPGIPFDDGSACAPELLWLSSGQFVPEGTVSAEAQTWGSMKALYR